MRKTILSFLLFMFAMAGISQQSINFTFTGVDNITYAQPDSIKIVNRTQACDTTLYWPDTLLSILYVNIPERINSSGTLEVFQNYPNPAKEETTVSVFVTENDVFSVMVSDQMGRNLIAETFELTKGINNFLFKPGNSPLYLFTVTNRVKQSCIKILNTPSENHIPELAYMGFSKTSNNLKELKSTQEFLFTPGDELLITAYHDNLESGILDTPFSNKDYVLQFAYGIPCPEMPTVTYEGVIYNTVQIFSQCWLKENLNVGTLIPGGDEMEDNGEIEKYCYDNDQANCNQYGGLYQWDEMMQYENQPGSQGICPEFWHIPTDEEWKILEGAADSLYGIGDTIWNETFYRGYNAGLNLKSTSGWNNNINGLDLYGFQAFPGGLRMTDGSFNGLLFRGYWGTSIESSDSETWRHYLAFNFDTAGHSTFSKSAGRAVRCLKD